MILAAGRGERMRPLTDTTPKPLLAVGGKPLLVHHIEKLKQAGVQDIVINYAWLGHKIEEYLGDGGRYGVHISYSPEIAGGLETAGGIKHALSLLGTEPFIVVNGDIYSEFDYKKLLQINLGEACGFLVLVNNPPHHLEGDFGLSPLGLVQLVRKYTFSGIALYKPQAFKEVPDAKVPLRPYFEKWISQERLIGQLSLDFWCDVGTPQRLEELDKRLSKLS